MSVPERVEAKAAERLSAPLVKVCYVITGNPLSTFLRAHEVFTRLLLVVHPEFKPVLCLPQLLGIQFPL